MTAAMDIAIVRPWWRKPRTLRFIAIPAAGVLTAFVLSAWFGGAQRTLRLPAINVEISTVTQDMFRDFVPLRSKVVPRDVVYLDALEGGRVERVLVEPGDVVTAGQPLVELTNTQLELDVLDREARLVESITQLQAYQTQLEQNRLSNDKALASIDYDIARLTRALERRQALTESGMLPREASDTVSDELDFMRKLRPLQARSNEQQNRLRVQQVPQIAAQLSKLQQDIEITRHKLDQLTVRAPVDGLMTAIDLKVGENPARGARLGEITPDTGYKLSADIDEYYLGRLRVDQTGTIDFDEQQVTVRVKRVLPQVTEGTFKVELAFEGEPPHGLLAGQGLQGKLALGNDTPALVLPAGAFLAETGGDWVFVLDTGRGEAQRRRIKTGRRNAEQIEILSGLVPGEQVITSNYSGFARIDRIELVH
ncbi:efflux RND transporter periplasmic adaptor subunit [Steroidobacter agaridevorans]|uniref:efflux RND transporter periplasmic adaptor subunit n=1 Tax=Steroidobacter agaridevorans TaxID=2695856 RepID=UPI00132A2818|nr:efflux RND transporter periplasmic adaptor subunit [Steroidobacter agaridevorans]GFE90787.1 ABC transporter permease [Steroidobacter agaridevorans]